MFLSKHKQQQQQQQQKKRKKKQLDSSEEAVQEEEQQDRSTLAASDDDEDDDSDVTRSNNGFTLSDDEDEDVDMQESDEEDDEFATHAQENSAFFLDAFGHQQHLEETEDNGADRALKKESFADKYHAYAASHSAWRDASGEEIGMRFGQKKKNKKSKKKNRGEEEEDDGIITGNEYEEKMRQYYVKLHPIPAWCEKATMRIMKIDSGVMHDENEHDREFQQILTKSDNVIDQSSHLARNTLVFEKKRDLNEELRQAKVRSIDFHPRANIALVHYANSNIALFQVDGIKNTLINVIKNEGNKSSMSRFCRNGKEIIQSSGFGFFFTIDLETATVKKISVPRVAGMAQTRDSLRHFDISPNNEFIAFCSTGGYIRLVSMRTKFALGELKMNKDVSQVAFSPDSRLLFSVGKGGMVYIWDMEQRKPLHVHKDEGSNDTISIAVSRDFKYYATGSSNGVVNIYSVHKILEERSHDPEPMGTVLNLTTSINLLEFNVDAQILAIGSTEKKNAVRLVHLPSFTVFSNFPAVQGASFIEPWSLGFNRSGGYFAVATTYCVFLYRIPYYKVL